MRSIKTDSRLHDGTDGEVPVHVERHRQTEQHVTVSTKCQDISEIRHTPSVCLCHVTMRWQGNAASTAQLRHNIRETRFKIYIQHAVSLYYQQCWKKLWRAFGADKVKFRSSESFVWLASETTVWRSGSIVRHMNKVNSRWARLVLGWATVFKWVYHLGMQSNQQGQLSCIHLGPINRVTALTGGDKGGNATAVEWKVTLSSHMTREFQ